MLSSYERFLLDRALEEVLLHARSATCRAIRHLLNTCCHLAADTFCLLDSIGKLFVERLRQGQAEQPTQKGHTTEDDDWQRRENVLALKPTKHVQSLHLHNYMITGLYFYEYLFYPVLTAHSTWTSGSLRVTQSQT